MKNQIRIGLVLISLLMVNITNAQDNSIRPQLWNNFYLGWNINEKLILTNALAYNVLLSNGYPWNEYSYSGAASYTIKPWISAGAGFYLASTRQSENLRSTEIRPFIALRLSTNANKRWLISNFSRMEWRNLRYDKGNSNMTFRFRNRTSAAFSLTQKTLLMDKI